MQSSPAQSSEIGSFHSARCLGTLPRVFVAEQCPCWGWSTVCFTHWRTYGFLPEFLRDIWAQVFVRTFLFCGDKYLGIPLLGHMANECFDFCIFNVFSFFFFYCGNSHVIYNIQFQPFLSAQFSGTKHILIVWNTHHRPSPEAFTFLDWNSIPTKH